MTPEAIAEIVKAVGIEPDDWQLLANDLAEDYAEYLRLKDRDKQPKPPTLKAVRKKAEELA